MKLSSELKIAETIGMIANQSGSICAPSIDVDFMKMCDKSNNSTNLMKAWIVGWTKANLK